MTIQIDKIEIDGGFIVYYASTTDTTECIAIVIFPARMLVIRKWKHTIYVYEMLDTPIMGRETVSYYIGRMIRDHHNEVRFSDKEDSLSYIRRKAPKSATNLIENFILAA